MLSASRSAVSISAAIAWVCVAVAARGTTCRAVRLRVEYQDRPMAVDAAQPALSWQMDDGRRGSKQTAYRVLVASRPELLKDGVADLWDSGKVESDQSLGLGYAGKPLIARERCWWTVRIWDADGRPGAWSAPASWEMGLLDGWQAKWIGMKARTSAHDDVSGARWIWYPEGDPHVSAPIATRYLRRRFDLPDKPVESAVLVIAVDDRATAYVNDRQVGTAAGWQHAQPLPMDARLKPGANVLAIAARNDRGPAGLAAVVRVTFADGSVQRIATGSEWKSANAEEPGWNTAAFDDSAWKSAMVVAAMGDQPWGIPVASDAPDGPMPLVRREFDLSKQVKLARLYVTARGSYRMSLNGRRVGNDVLTPDWTDYRKHISYQVYDVASLLKPGRNAIGAMLGDGWYGSGLGWQLQRWSFGPPPVQLLAQLEIEYTDGTRVTVATDGTWRVAPGPVQSSEIYAGENYDATREQPGWDLPGFDDAAWASADDLGAATDTSGPVLTAQASPCIQVTQTLRPKAVSNPAPGVFVFDMGQNMVGWARLRVSGRRGDRVRMRFAEILQPNGQIYTENLRKAADTDTYTLRGGVQEVFEPHFTYRGYRYVEVTGYPGKPGPDALTGIVFNTNVPLTGSIECSEPLVGRILGNIDWGLRGNLESVPTDCPQRDERLGWMGDAEIIWPTAAYFRDMQSFSHKWSRDVRDAQSAEGGYSDVSPRVIDMADGAPAWGDAGVIVPYATWRQYGDTGVIRENWDAMVKWVHYIHDANPNLLWVNRRNNNFGDWVAANSDTDRAVIATAFFAQDARMMADMARALGDSTAEVHYHALYDAIREAFDKAYVQDDGTVGNGSQTCYVLALHNGLLDEQHRRLAAAKLVADIASRGGHLSTGFIGTAYLLPALSDTGHDDVAYQLLLNTTYPSWGYEISKGATTIWERWNGDTGDPGMNSFNHYAFGSVGEWIYGYLGGIEAGQGKDGAGFRHVVIRPRTSGAVTWARASYDSAYGPIATDWRRDGSRLALAVTIPANTTAEVYVPAASADRVTESGRSASSAQGVRFLRMEDGCAVFAVGAGRYSFAAT